MSRPYGQRPRGPRCTKQDHDQVRGSQLLWLKLTRPAVVEPVHAGIGLTHGLCVKCDALLVRRERGAEARP